MPRGSRRSKRSWAQRLVLGINVLLAAACVAAGLGLMQVRRAIESVPVVDIGSSLAPPTEVSDPRNFLIIGTDSAEGLDEDDPVMKNRELGGQLADVIMIVRVDPKNHTVRILSIPRDSRVELPSGRMGRINAAMSGVGGEANVVRTIKRNFGIPIDNYLQVDFLGFRKLVEVLGGVPVYFTTPVRDRNSGLAIEEAGCKVLGPDQALAYARARHFYFYEDGRWRPDGTGDLGRISRQQDFIKRALRKAAEEGLRNPTTALSLINAASSAVRMDSTLDVGTLVSLAREFQSFNPEAIESMQVPTRAAPRGGVAYQDVLWDEAEPMLEQFRGVPAEGPIDPMNILVEVSSRSTKDSESEAASAVRALDDAGFDADLAQSKSTRRTTTIYYGPNGRDAAIRLAAQLQVLPEFTFDEEVRGSQARLSIGSDFEGVRSEAVALDQLPADRLPRLPGPEDDQSDPNKGPDDSGNTVNGEPVNGEDSETDQPETDQPETGQPEKDQRGVVPTDPEASALCR